MGRETVLNKAEEIQRSVYFSRDLSEINTDIESYMSVTLEDIIRVANTYLVDNNRTVVIAVPASKEG